MSLPDAVHSSFSARGTFSDEVRNAFLDFAIEFFTKRFIHARLMSADEAFPRDADLGLRRCVPMPQPQSPRQFAGPEAEKAGLTAAIYLTDRFECHFILIPVRGLVEEAGPAVLFIGPYLTRVRGIQGIRELCEIQGIPAEYILPMNQYASTLPMVEDVRDLELFVDSLVSRLCPESPGPVFVRESYSRLPELLTVGCLLTEEESAAALQERYRLEEELMNAIAAGNPTAAVGLISHPVFSALDSRTPDFLRDRKNYLIILNTLSRKAAQRGHVHPVYLDELSRRFAVQIEGLASPSQVMPLRRDIVRRYALLVLSSGIRTHSPVIRDILRYIPLHLTESDLTLAVLAGRFSLNKSYLASLFKKETGTTLVTYIHERRLEHAIFLLNAEGGSVQSVASACGIPDISYFSRLFRAKYGMSPMQYRQMILGRQTQGGALDLSISDIRK